MRKFLKQLSDWNGQGAVSIVGQTGSSKSSAALDLVRARWPLDLKHPLLVSVDSVALYRGLDIGSAKVAEAERALFDWAGLDLFEPSEKVSVASFLDKIALALREAQSALRPLIIVGGSHFYERALVDGRGPGAPSDPVYQAGLDPLSNDELFARLKRLDPRWSARLHPNDRYRLRRFLDLAEHQALPLERIFEERLTPLTGEVHTFVQGASLEIHELKERLVSRLQKMLEAGWVAEVESLLARGLSPEVPSLQTVGYREIVAHLRHELAASELEQALLISHLQLAKKQRTWIRGLLSQ